MSDAVALAQVPLFAALDATTLDAVASRCTARRYAKGDTLWNSGDLADDLLVVVSGLLEVWGGVAGGEGQVIGRIGPGECVGELGLLLGERRTAAVTCARAAEVLVLGRADFAELITTNQGALAVLLGTVSQRARSLATGSAPPSGTRIVLVTQRDSAGGASLVAAALAECAVACGAGEALLVTVGVDGADIEARGDHAAHLRLAASSNADAIDELHRVAEGRFRLVVVALERSQRGELAAWADRCDAVVEIVAPGAVAAASATITVLNLWPTHAAPADASRPSFVLPAEASLAGLSLDAQARWIATHPTSPLSRVVFRLTRTLLGASVGVALGAGAAFGIAHVGVLAALEDAGIPVDVVSGSSFGSIIGAGLAGGLSPAEMTEIARRIGNVRTALSALDPSLSGAGLLAGKRLIAIFSPFLSQRYFHELVMPMAAVTTDIATGERVAITRGEMWDPLESTCRHASLSIL